MIKSIYFIAVAAVIAIAAPSPVTATPAQKCEGERRFETPVEFEQYGRKVPGFLVVCDKKNDDAAAWVRELEATKARILADLSISEKSKANVVGRLNAEIAEFTGKPSQ